MAAEFTYIPAQQVQANRSILLETSIPCPKGYVLHREGSGIVTCRGIVNNNFANFARYELLFKGNVAIPAGGTLGEIDIAICIAGEPLQSSLAISTPAALGDYNNVVALAVINVPRGCCYNVTVDNVSADNQTISVQNALLRVNRVA